MFFTSSTFVIKNKNDAKIEKPAFYAYPKSYVKRPFNSAPFNCFLPTILNGNMLNWLRSIRLVRTAFSACAVLLSTLNE